MESTFDFYNTCVKKFHETGMKNNYINSSELFLSDIIVEGRKHVLDILKDDYFRSEYGSQPMQYYFMVVSFYFQAGMADAVLFVRDRKNFNDKKFMKKMMEEGPFKTVKPELENMGLSEEKLAEIIRNIFFDWYGLMTEYFQNLPDEDKKKDEDGKPGLRDYVFNACLASCQFGITLVLNRLKKSGGG